MKTRYDLRENSRTFSEEEKVWLHNPTQKKGRSLTNYWEGSYKVIQNMNDLVYQIQKTPKSKMEVVHLYRLQPYALNNNSAVRDEQI